MKLLLKGELESLIGVRDELAVSIYLPTHKSGKEVTQNPVQFRGVLKKAERLLEDGGVRDKVVRDLLAPAYELLTDIEFWRHQSDCLAVFLAPGFFRYYRLPLLFQRFVHVSERLHIKPLLKVFMEDSRFFVLALSQKRARLLQGSRDGLSEVALQSLPQGLREALGDEVMPRLLHFHASAPEGSGGKDVIYHGTGSEPDTKNAILRYFRKIDRSLKDLLHDERSPLVIACVDYLFPIYKQANTYNHLFPDFIPGNPDPLTPEELHERAWALLRPYFEKGRAEAARTFVELWDKGSPLALVDVERIVPASHWGVVEHLFVPVGVQVWGLYDQSRKEVSLLHAPEPGCEDLLDLAAVHTLLNGGRVYAVDPLEMPAEGKAAAVLRYELPA